MNFHMRLREAFLENKLSYGRTGGARSPPVQQKREEDLCPLRLWGERQDDRRPKGEEGIIMMK